jgi:hypothetical protein
LEQEKETEKKKTRKMSERALQLLVEFCPL